MELNETNRPLTEVAEDTAATTAPAANDTERVAYAQQSTQEDVINRLRKRSERLRS